VLFSDPAMAGELRYFEVAPGGFSTLERHEHMHGVLILHGSGHCLVGDEVKSLETRDLVTVPPMTWHQFRASKDEPLGFLCMVNAEREPQLPTPDDLARLRRNPAIATSSTTNHDCKHHRPGPLGGRRARRRDRHPHRPEVNMLQWRIDRRRARGARRARRHKGLRAVMLKGNGKHFQAGAVPEMDSSGARLAAGGKPARFAREPRRPCSSSMSRRSDELRWCRRLLWRRHRNYCGLRRRHRGDNALFSIAEVRWGLHASIIIRSSLTRSACGTTPLRADRRALRRRGSLPHRAGAQGRAARRAGSEGARMSRTCWRTGRMRLPRPRPGCCARPGAISTPRLCGADREPFAKAPSRRGRRGLASFAEKRAGNWRKG